MSNSWRLIIGLQVILLGVELLTSYDTWVRQVALVVTNLATTTGLVLMDRSLRRTGQRLSLVIVILVIAAVWVDALGNFQHLYARFWWWDRVAHTIGGLGVTALFMALALVRRATLKLNVSVTVTLWFGFLLGQFVAAMYEVSEWLGDWWFATERVRGLFDAPRDLFFNAVGGAIGVAVFYLVERKKLNVKLSPDRPAKT